MRRPSKIQPSYIKEKANKILIQPDLTVAERRVIIFFTETILHDFGVYKGFRYLTEKEVPEGELPGIREEVDDRHKRHHNTDVTRIAYL